MYRQVANHLINLIREGRLQPGTFLPSTREMAELLDLHRKTVVAAYEELSLQDWTQTIPRKGVLVSRRLPEIKPRGFQPGGSGKRPAAALEAGPGSGPGGWADTAPIAPYAGQTGFAFTSPVAYPSSAGANPGPNPGANPGANIPHPCLIINDGFPDIREAPLDLLLRECRRLAGSKAYGRSLMYGSSAGTDHLRAAFAGHLSATRGLAVGPDNLLVTRGAQMAIYLAAAMLIRPGDKVIVGASNYRFADACFEQLGATLLRVPVDEQGIDVEAVRALCAKYRVRMLYVIPHHHHPTTVTLSVERRMQLLELIRAYNLPVIEDDYDYDFHYASGPILPLASADHGGNVLYIGSFTKSLALSIRVGFLAAPAGFIRETVRLRRLMDLRGDNLLEEALAAMIDNGDIGRYLKKAAKLFGERRDVLCHALEDQLGDLVRFKRPDGGLAVWAVFPPGYSLPDLSVRAAGLGLSVTDGSFYRFDGQENGLRIGFASLSAEEIGEVVRILSACV